uniref:BEACH domain-containing protein n=1 Tax=Mesocestoides corti TaxID=53468 RepID=A0A5K3G0C7_MESCO
MYGAYRREFLQEAVLGRAVSPLREAMLYSNNILHPDYLFFPHYRFQQSNGPVQGLPAWSITLV